jgi:hypothetical protein
MGGVDVSSTGLALLAFVLALYVLAARDQKTPYMTTSVYATALIIFIAISLSIAAKLINSYSSYISSIINILSVLFLDAGIIYIFFKVWNAHNRKVNLRDDNLFKNLKLVRWIKNIRRSASGLLTYEHNALGVDKSLLDYMKAQELLPKKKLDAALSRIQDVEIFTPLSLSIAYVSRTLVETDQLLLNLAITFLKHNCSVQYATCTRHLIEFILQLRKAWKNTEQTINWSEVSNRIVAVDAYTPHFGFVDSIYNKATKGLRELGVDPITAKASYASLHTASARAFNRIKERSAGGQQQVRRPTLLIYDGPYALVDLESVEQYRIFIRHLLPSERLWGGMFTVVIESVIDDQGLALLKAYADVFIDLHTREQEDEPLLTRGGDPALFTERIREGR